MEVETEPLTTGTLEERSKQLVTLLSDENFEGDTDALIAESQRVEGEIKALNTRRNTAEAMRSRLAGASFTPAIEPEPEIETRTDAPRIDLRAATEDFATRAAQYSGGRMDMNLPHLDVRTVLSGNGANSSNSAGGFIPLVPQPGVIPVNPDRPLRLADVITRANTGSPIIEYVRDTTAKGGGSPGFADEASTKAETAYTFDLVSDNVRTVAHFTNVTRQIIADVGQLQSYVQDRLVYGLGYKLDDSILNGSGSGITMRGILNVSGINLYDPLHATTPYTEARVISIRKAMTTVFQGEYAPTAVALSPGDWQLVELSTDDRGMFRVSPNVQDSLNPRIWGLSVIQTTALADGTSVVGDFKLGATLWDRQESTIYVTDSHASNFTANVLTLLAELRVGLAVHRVGAFCKILFNGAS